VARRPWRARICLATDSRVGGAGQVLLEGGLVADGGKVGVGLRLLGRETFLYFVC